MSAASLLPAGCRFHSSASAKPEKVNPRKTAAQVAMLRAGLLAISVSSRIRSAICFQVPARCAARVDEEREHPKQRRRGNRAVALKQYSQEPVLQYGLRARQADWTIACCCASPASS